MNNYKKPVNIVPATTHCATVIWLHGLGADGYDFEPIVPQLAVADLGIKFIFPHANNQPVSINGGMMMPSWYDIVGVDLDNRADETGIQESVRYINQLIENEIAEGIPSTQIVLAGFSQGGVVCLHAGLTFPQKLAGLMCLSTYLPLAQKLQTKLQPVNQDTPIFNAHGSMDPMVQLALGDHLVNQLQSWHYSVEAYRYPMQHAVCPQEITQIGHWLRKVLQKSTD
ncbi:MAG: carboxylesterase [Gammaproteobacteria bacterium CG22_combo_CG10-13_8_21_14_all_40_8]|nr:MAG: carboxylesterase [Gammaproteobacteria bacterium CG22_combo_CG10-13_8_21_14_all_40_8]